LIRTVEEAPRRPPQMELLGLPMHRVGVDQVHAFIEETISSNRRAIALNLNVFCVNLALKHQWLHEFIRSAHLVFCDGDGVRLGLRLLGENPPPKITYNEWLWQLCAFCEQRGFRIFLLGGKPGIAEEAARNLIARYPRLQLAGVHDGYFRKDGEDTRRVIAQINAASPDILLVCLGMPTQERWLRDHWRSIDAHVFLKGGAALDYASGRLRKAPAWMIRAQLEWLFRLGQEPIRLFTRYVLGNPYFVYRVCRERVSRTLRRLVYARSRVTP
jgi:N-acetylglucosaminyldiphosphoundecaprenol N-acetyl-beta-D-mannosaminyltransferase